MLLHKKNYDGSIGVFTWLHLIHQVKADKIGHTYQPGVIPFGGRSGNGGGGLWH